MPYSFNPFTGNFDDVGSGGAPGGADTQVQFNDNGSFGGDVDLTYNKTTNLLTTKGDVRLDDGGVYTTTLQTITATANRTISFPDATGTLALVGGSSGQAIYNNGGALAGISTMTFDGTSVTLAGRLINSYNSASLAPAKVFTGTWATGFGATNTKPHFLIEPTGTSSGAWSPNGTGLGVNAASTFSGNLLDLQVNGTSLARITSGGTLACASSISLNNRGGFFAGPDGIATTNGGLELGWGGAAGLSVRGNSEIRIAPSAFLGFGSILGSPDAGWFRDAANTLAQRNGTNAQTYRVYDTYTSATDYHRIAIATARATLSAVSGASVTATALIPAGAVVMGVTSKVTTALGTSNGTTGYQIGTGADPDRWGAITGTALGTTSDNRNWTAGTIECFPAATDVIVTATGGNFNGTGVIYLSVQYMAGEAD